MVLAVSLPKAYLPNDVLRLALQQPHAQVQFPGAVDAQGCGPQGAAVSSLTSCDMMSGRIFDANPSMKSLLA
jgi:hypothetical protein